MTHQPAAPNSAFFWRDNPMPHAPTWWTPPKTGPKPKPKAPASVPCKSLDTHGRRTVALAPKATI